VEAFREVLPLATIRAAAGLEELALVQRGSRLSVMPVSEEQWEIILGLARR